MPRGCELKSGPSRPERSLHPSSNMPATLMNLKVLLPFQIFAEKTGVSRIVAETRRVRLDSCLTDSIAWRRWRPGF